MILIGQYDSSFVRRCGIALTLYGIPFEHRPWSVFSDAEKVRAVNPLMRVPVLILDNGDVLPDSATIIDTADRMAPPEKRLFPEHAPDRHRAMAATALATGLGDKVVSLFYEIHMHEQPSHTLVSRLALQIGSALDALEASRGAGGTPFWFGEAMTHADIAAACMIRHGREALLAQVSLEGRPALQAHCAAMEALPVFQAISQPFIPPR
jgi:glutathione S-transferase